MCPRARERTDPVSHGCAAQYPLEQGEMNCWLFRATPCARLGIDTERRESIESSTYCRIPILKLPVITESRRVVAWEPENTRKDVRERGGRRHRKRSEGGVPSHRSLSAPLLTRIGGGGRNMRQSSWRPPLAGKKMKGRQHWLEEEWKKEK